MSKQIPVTRQSIIIKQLKKCALTFNDLNKFLKKESDLLGCDLTVSKRTFQRDILEIVEMYNIVIKNRRKGNCYFIDNNDKASTFHNHQLLESFNLFNTLVATERYSDIVLFEEQRPLGTECFSDLIAAIRSKRHVKFNYDKFWDSEFKERLVLPLALKEFKRKWYLIAKEPNIKKIKTYGLDRISALEVTRVISTELISFNPKSYYKDCFGIQKPEDEKPENIELSFDSQQGKYIKEFPLHASQKIIEETEKKLTISIYVYITEDLLGELLSYGDSVAIVSSKTLKKQMRKVYENALG